MAVCSLASAAERCIGHSGCFAQTKGRVKWAASHLFSVGYVTVRLSSWFVNWTTWSEAHAKVPKSMHYFSFGTWVVWNPQGNHGSWWIVSDEGIKTRRTHQFFWTLHFFFFFPVSPSLFPFFTAIPKAQNMYSDLCICAYIINMIDL